MKPRHSLFFSEIPNKVVFLYFLCTHVVSEHNFLKINLFIILVFVFVILLYRATTEAL